MKTRAGKLAGLSLIEVVIAIVAISVLITAFIPVFAIVTKGSVSSQQSATMENLAASYLDKVLSGLYSTACTNPSNVTLANTTYAISIACSSNTPIVGGKHVVVSVSCSGCIPVSISGDAYDIW